MSDRNPVELILRDPSDRDTYYHIESFRNISNYTTVNKFQFNSSIWPFPCILKDATLIAACVCRELLIIAFDDDSVAFIDTNTAMICLPAILIDGGISYLSKYEDEFIIFASQTGSIIVLQQQNYDLKMLFNEQIHINTKEIKQITMTIEIESRKFTPIIEFSNLTVRWSHKMNHWVVFKQELPNDSPDCGSLSFETVADLENAFMKALLFGNHQRAHQLFKVGISLNHPGQLIDTPVSIRPKKAQARVLSPEAAPLSLVQTSIARIDPWPVQTEPIARKSSPQSSVARFDPRRLHSEPTARVPSPQRSVARIDPRRLHSEPTDRVLSPQKSVAQIDPRPVHSKRAAHESSPQTSVARIDPRPVHPDPTARESSQQKYVARIDPLPVHSKRTAHESSPQTSVAPIDPRPVHTERTARESSPQTLPTPIAQRPGHLVIQQPSSKTVSFLPNKVFQNQLSQNLDPETKRSSEWKQIGPLSPPFFTRKYNQKRQYSKYHQDSVLVDEVLLFFSLNSRTDYTLKELEDQTNIDQKVLSKWRKKYEKDPLYRPESRIGQHRRIFTDDEEKAVADFLRIQFLLPGIILKRSQLQDLLFDCWKSFDVESRSPHKKNFFSDQFVKGFCKRHRFSFRKIRRKRRSDLDADEVDQFARDLRDVATSYPRHRILNMDETPWNIVLMNGEVLAETGIETVMAVLPDDPRKSFTAIATIGADGSRYPPLFLAKGTTTKSHRQFADMQSDPIKYNVFHSAKGYTTEDVMAHYFALLNSWMDGEACALLLDRFAAHISEKTRAEAARYNIRLVLIPTSGTELFQPLDLRVFGCLKSMARSIYDEDLYRKQTGYTRSEAADVFVKCWNKIPHDVIRKAWNIADDENSDDENRDENDDCEDIYIDDPEESSEYE